MSGLAADPAAQDLDRRVGLMQDYRLDGGRLTAVVAGTWDEVYPGADSPMSLHTVSFLIVDDCALYRDYLVQVLVSRGASTPAVAWDLASLAAAFPAASPRVVLLNMATQQSVLLLRQVLQLNPGVRVVAMGIPEDDESTIIACAEAGVVGYHLRNESLRELLELVPKVVVGEPLCPPKVSAILLRRLSTLATQRRQVPSDLVLTAREVQILRMLELGLANREIAEELCIAIHTVKNHVHSLLAKLGVSTRAQAAALARTVVCAAEQPEG